MKKLGARSTITARRSRFRNGTAVVMLGRKASRLLKQGVDNPLVTELNRRRHPSPLPVIDALLVSGLSSQPEQAPELGVPASSINDHLGIGRIHGQD